MHLSLFALRLLPFFLLLLCVQSKICGISGGRLSSVFEAGERMLQPPTPMLLLMKMPMTVTMTAARAQQARPHHRHTGRIIRKMVFSNHFLGTLYTYVAKVDLLTCGYVLCWQSRVANRYIPFKRLLRKDCEKLLRKAVSFATQATKIPRNCCKASLVCPRDKKRQEETPAATGGSLFGRCNLVRRDGGEEVELHRLAVMMASPSYSPSSTSVRMQHSTRS